MDPISEVVDLMYDREMQDPYEYPYLIRKNVSNTTKKELSSFFVMHEGAIYLSLLGEREVLSFLEISEKIYLQKKFSRFSPYLSELFDGISSIKHKPVVTNWKEAEAQKSLSLYFKDRDYLGVIKGESRDVEIIYNDDYEEYIKSNFSLKEIASLYLKYLERVQRVDDTELNYEVFSNQMAYKSLKQRYQYAAVIDKYDDMVIASDGLGVFSSMCILADKKFCSWEPKPIGERAIKLGIISQKETIIKEGIYVFFYCVKYYTLPMFPFQKFLVIDVPLVKKPGFCDSLFFSSSDPEMTVDIDFPTSPMKLSTVYPLDPAMSNIASVLRIKSADILKSQYIAVSNTAALTTAVVSGFFSFHKVSQIYYSLDIVEQKRFGSVGSLETYLRDKTLLFFERTFPFRQGDLKWRMRGVYFRKDVGPGWYDDINSSWMGVNNSVKYLTDYEFHNSFFFVKLKGKPPLVHFLKLTAILIPVFNSTTLKVLLVSTVLAQGQRMGIYMPEQNVSRKNILIEEDLLYSFNK